MYNSNYNNLPGNNFTFHPTFIPPPPQPPRFFLPPNSALYQELNDREFIKNIEAGICSPQSKPFKRKFYISQVFDQLRSIVLEVNELKDKNKTLTESMSSISDDDWNMKLREIEGNKVRIADMLKQIKNIDLNDLSLLLPKRRAKRLRLKRVKMEKKREREEKIKEMQERSRKIDEQLQKIKEEVIRMKQEEEAKLQADIILKEVSRKKHDAKKCIAKLDAFMKLRRARQNTMKGRGEVVSENEANAFNSNIEKLKSLWSQKLTIYEKEESELRKKLEHDSEGMSVAEKQLDEEIIKNLEEWRLVLFGGSLPQVDFKDDIARFIAIRSQWDQFIDTSGTPLPIGWVTPTVKEQ